MADKNLMINPQQALAGRQQPITNPGRHFVLGTPMIEETPGEHAAMGLETAVFGLGCFWGAERRFWEQPGVYTTAAGYAGGYTPNPTYEEVCSGQTGHTEAVLVVFDSLQLEYASLLRLFWESHNPTQGMRQGNDRGTQYRSAIYTFGQKQQEMAESSRQKFQQILNNAGFGTITTEILPAHEFYYAEEYHQQYLAKNPGGYCGLGGTGLRYA